MPEGIKMNKKLVFCLIAISTIFLFACSSINNRLSTEPTVTPSMSETRVTTEIFSTELTTEATTAATTEVPTTTEAPKVLFKSVDLTANIGDKYTLEYTLTGDGELSWKSSAPTIVEISDSGIVELKSKGISIIMLSVSGGNSDTLVITVVDPSATEAPTVEKSAAKYVITNSGKKYHYASCRTVKSIKAYVTASEAKAMGYSACGVCHPG